MACHGCTLRPMHPNTSTCLCGHRQCLRQLTTRCRADPAERHPSQAPRSMKLEVRPHIRIDPYYGPYSPLSVHMKGRLLHAFVRRRSGLSTVPPSSCYVRRQCGLLTVLVLDAPTRILMVGFPFTVTWCILDGACLPALDVRRAYSSSFPQFVVYNLHFYDKALLKGRNRA